MKKQYNECQVVLLPTEKPTNLFKDVNGFFHTFGQCQPQTGHSINSDVVGYFMYIVSNGIKKVNDWCLHKYPFYALHNGHIEKPILVTQSNCFSIQEHWNKIIATHNCILNDDGLSLISIEFIQQYCDSNGKIDKVLVEYELDEEIEGYSYYTLKLDNNNIITIKLIKPNFGYTTDQLVLLHDYHIQVQLHSLNGYLKKIVHYY